ncbi:hypothetical protein [Pelomonas sp. Root1217]|uniref:hypothetical protein n=1 Tax=Pelomonas sp. Root1217 TaxID=1736430 RepID=UPI0012FB0C0E|nr:hypothetical protein [Pelomonas sp. Root1217]
MTLEVPLPSLSVQQAFNQLHAQVTTTLKAKRTAIRQESAILLPDTLERLFNTSTQGASHGQ